MKLTGTLLDLLFPPKCPFCRRVLDAPGMCPECEKTLVGTATAQHQGLSTCSIPVSSRQE